MPAKAPSITKSQEKDLRQLGQQLRDRRKELGISATTTAEAAGMSRITLYRIERGEASVAMGAYLSVIQSLGLKLVLTDPQKKQIQKGKAEQKVPKKIRVSDYKQLKRIAWQLKGSQELNPQEALDLYERNWRHIDLKKMDAREKKLLELLLAAAGRERLLV
ncbi:MAG: helix-turn-helix domain-containing protein [Pseudobdellovibrionaceae bacterium]